eukprot:TRINITY_DN26104_c0_g1_i2.p1 TRINITY_DN26104_c0_g1~~TRINITY_DN26104_c0_g1_i2.p1  ORF type:complete len:1208 (-),score=166.70 TRINITY_DN26104_c0_g1_i2:140-3280(-)
MSAEAMFIMKSTVEKAKEDGLHLDFFRTYQNLGGSSSKYFTSIAELVSATGDYTLVHGPGQTVCDPQHEMSASEGVSKSECESRCSQDNACAYYTFFTLSGTSTCRLSWACRETSLAVSGGSAEVFRKNVTAPGFTSCATPDADNIARFFLERTNDAGGVKSSSDGQMSLVCLFDIFFLTPACRASPMSCIPVVTYNMFFYQKFLQQAVAHELPFAIANLDSYSTWVNVVSQKKVIFYYWSPDPLFLGQVDRLILRESNDKEWDAGIWTRAEPQKVLPHYVYNKLPKVVPAVASLIQEFGLSIGILEDLMFRLADQKTKVSSGLLPVGSDSIDNVSCEWLKESERHWSRWLLGLKTCKIGSGLADDSGAMVYTRIEAQQCVTCPAGRFSRELLDSDGLTYVCALCPAGKRQPQVGQSKCLECAAGRFTPDNASLECTMCPRGKFQPRQGMTRCVDCDKDLTTSTIGAVSDSCHCPTGYFRPCKNPVNNGRTRAECPCPPTNYADVEAGTNASGCLVCPEGAECVSGADEKFVPCSVEDPGHSANGTYPVPKSGYYATIERPLTLYLCLLREACPGGMLETCSGGKEGIACGKCATGYYLKNKHECAPCSEAMKSVWVLPGIPVLAIPFVIILAYPFFQTPVDKWDNLKNGLANTAYVCFSGIQTVGTALLVFPVVPKAIEEGLAWTEGAWQIAELLLVECSIPDSFFNGFMLKLLLPLAAAGFFFLTYVVTYPTKWRMQADAVVGMYGSGYRFLFIAICAQNFNLFQLYLHPNGSYSMRSAPTITNKSQTWLSLFALTLGFVMLNCLAVAACLAALLQAKHHFSSISFRRRWKFILIQMRPSRYAWIIMLIIKGFYLACTSVLFDLPGTQVAWLQFAVIAYLSGVVAYMPWRSTIVCILDVFIHFVLMVLFFLMPYFFDLGDDGAMDILSVFLFTGLGAAAVGLIGLLVVLFEMSEGNKRRRLAELEKSTAIIVSTLSEMTSREVMAELLMEIPTQDRLSLTYANTVLKTEALAIKQPWFLQWRSESELKADVRNSRSRDAQWKLL